MQPRYLPLSDIFGSQTRFTVPLFQRPYVWSQEQQWEPLWADVKNLANRIVRAKAGDEIASHFLGTVVLVQRKVQTGSVQQREVIDGQQRLTTLQILLQAASHVLHEYIDEAEADKFPGRFAPAVNKGQIDFLIANQSYAESTEQYKVWPTNEDRTPFMQVMDSKDADDLQDIETRMSEAYWYFYEEMDGWLEKCDNQNKYAALASSLKDHLKLIVLDLDDSDEPQAIFETLNAHGTPLLPADLIKNWCLWEAKRQDVESEIPRLYEDFWRPFDRDSDYWRESVGTGHAARARVDLFLQYWVTRQVMKMFPARYLYHHFLQFAATDPYPKEDSIASVERMMRSINSDAIRFKHIENPPGNTRFDLFLKRLDTFGFVVFYPVLLELMGRKGSDQKDLDSIGLILESYLLRRMVCKESTRGYGAFSIALLEAIKKTPEDQPASDGVKAFILSQDSTSLAWPTDAEFSHEWLNGKFYRTFRRDRVLMILKAIEQSLHLKSSKGEPIVNFDFDALQIEHIMPVKWQQYWPVGKDLEKIQTREQHLNRIGNLTLVSGKLNPSLSNSSWLTSVKKKKGKRDALEEHSQLVLNAKLIKENPEGWNEEAIQERAEQLLKSALKIWPRPKSEA